MNEDNIIEEQSPVGYRVVCAKARWKAHVVDSHPGMEGRIEEVRLAITRPAAVYSSKEPTGRHVYFGNIGTKVRYMKVVVQPPDEYNEDGELVTAFPHKDIGGNVDKLIYVDVKSR
jgi:hypothetical protein